MVTVAGRDLASEVCASYLAGAGVARLEVDRALISALDGLNADVELCAIESGPGLVVAVGDARHEPAAGPDVARGASAARWALARILS